MSSTGTCDLIVRNARVVTADDEGTVLAGSVAIKDGRIAGMAADHDIAGRYTASRTLDAEGAAVHPGFIDAHIHISQYTARTLLPVLDRAGKTMGHWKAQLSPADEAASARLAILDLFRAGYTGFVDPGTVFEPDAVAETAAAAGIRAWLTDPYVADRGPGLASIYPELFGGGFLERWPHSTDEAKSRIGGQLFRNDQDGLVRGFIGLYGEGSDSLELYRHAVEVARAADVTVQEHLGYTPARILAESRQHGRTPVQRRADAGLLDEHSSFVHMNRITPADADLLTHAGASLVWCPYGQLQALALPGAQPRMPELWRRGLAIGLGSDIARIGNLDDLGTLAMAVSTTAADAAQPAEILRMRCAGAARTVGAHDLGTIQVGNRADVVIRRPTAAESLGGDVDLETGVLGARGSVRTVIVNGTVVYDDGHPTQFDETQAVIDARASALTLRNRIGLE